MIVPWVSGCPPQRPPCGDGGRVGVQGGGVIGEVLRMMMLVMKLLLLEEGLLVLVELGGKETDEGERNEGSIKGR